MKRFSFRSLGYHFVEVGLMLAAAVPALPLAAAVSQRKTGITVLCALLIVAFLVAAFLFSFLGKMVVTQNDVRIHAPACVPKRFAYNKVKVIFIRFKKQERHEAYAASVEVRLVSGARFRFDFLHSAPKGVVLGRLSPKQKAKLEALAASCEKVSCETIEA